MLDKTCSVSGCKNKYHTKGLCSSHYHRQRRYGSFELPKHKREVLLELGKSYCPCCNLEKDLSCFSTDIATWNKKAIYCKICSMRKSADSYAKNKDRYKNYSLSSKYGISLEKYREILESQNNSCRICYNKTPKRFVVDHNHSTGEVRGILCDLCNIGIGHFRDSPQIVESCLIYLKSFSIKNE